MVRKRSRAELLHGKKSLVVYTQPDAVHASQFRQIRAFLQYAAQCRKLKKLLVSSPGIGEGKTTTSVNLAISLAQRGDSVLLVDANTKNPMIHHAFNMNNVPGLLNVLAGQLPVTEAIHKTNIGRLDVLFSGGNIQHASELIVSEQMTSLLEKMSKDYDMIILDVPPVLDRAETVVLSGMCDGTLLVIKNGKTKIDAASAAKHQLDQAKAHIVGVVLNEC